MNPPNPEPHLDRSHQITYSSELARPPAEIWAHLESLDGVNRELWPICRMTFPEWARTLTPETVPLGKTLFRSWILLGGFLPIDYDDIALVRLEPGKGFLESSKMWTQEMWEHERTLEPLPGGCRITDRVRFVPRIPWLAPFFVPMFHLAFWNRHRRLRQIFGALG